MDDERILQLVKSAEDLRIAEGFNPYTKEERQNAISNLNEMSASFREYLKQNPNLVNEKPLCHMDMSAYAEPIYLTSSPEEE